MSQLQTTSPAPGLKFSSSTNSTEARYTTPTYNKFVVGSIFLVFLVIVLFVLALVLRVKVKRFLYLRNRASSGSRPIISHRIVIPLQARPSAVAPAPPAHTAATGLDKATISQLPTFVYKTAATSDQLAGKAECAVCLCKFQENDNGRLLPSCKHSFHTECIDMWLLSNSTCPLCRSEVISDAGRAVATQEQQHRERDGQLGAAPLRGVGEGNPIGSSVTTGRCAGSMVLQAGDRMRVVFLQRPSSSSTTSSNTVLPQVTINIPPMVGGSTVRVSASTTSVTRCTCLDPTSTNIRS